LFRQCAGIAQLIEELRSSAPVHLSFAVDQEYATLKHQEKASFAGAAQNAISIPSDLRLIDGCSPFMQIVAFNPLYH
jgi:hypothetical protein